ncbi:hypothetical protein BXU08_11480 [Sphingomonas sp. LM7]|nr:hypothetical protein BXU08_11480 [Sphingomonas sp. LM7]
MDNGVRSARFDWYSRSQIDDETAQLDCWFDERLGDAVGYAPSLAYDCLIDLKAPLGTEN